MEHKEPEPTNYRAAAEVLSDTPTAHLTHGVRNLTLTLEQAKQFYEAGELPPFRYNDIVAQATARMTWIALVRASRNDALAHITDQTKGE